MEGLLFLFSVWAGFLPCNSGLILASSNYIINIPYQFIFNILNQCLNETPVSIMIVKQNENVTNLMIQCYFIGNRSVEATKKETQGYQFLH